MTKTCPNLQKSLDWCQGTAVYPGIRRRIYYISKQNIVDYPTLPRDENGRPTSTELKGDFSLASDATWKYIDVLVDKSKLTSEAQGEEPSQTQLNKLEAVHPGVGAEASAAAAYLNNNDNVYLVQDMAGRYRVLGNDKWQTKSTVAQDLGQGNNAAGTTINAECTDEVPCPFYGGKIVTEDGEINASPSATTTNPSGGS